MQVVVSEARRRNAGGPGGWNERCESWRRRAFAKILELAVHKFRLENRWSIVGPGAWRGAYGMRKKDNFSMTSSNKQAIEV